MVVKKLQMLSRVTSLVSWLGIVFMMCSITYDVFQRQAEVGLVSGLLEYNETLLVFVIFGSLGYAQQQDDHVSTDVVYRLLPRPLRTYLQGCGLLIVAVALGWAVQRSWLVGLDAMARNEYRSGLAQVPTWQARLFVPFALLMLLVEVLIRATRLFTGYQDDCPLLDREQRVTTKDLTT